MKSLIIICLGLICSLPANACGFVQQPSQKELPQNVIKMDLKKSNGNLHRTIVLNKDKSFSFEGSTEIFKGTLTLKIISNDQELWTRTFSKLDGPQQIKLDFKDIENSELVIITEMKSVSGQYQFNWN